MTFVTAWRAPWWMIRGEWRAHPARIVTAVIAIAVGVALGLAVHLVNASALDRFARGLALVRGRADLSVTAAGPDGIDERLYPRLARLAGIAAASPVVDAHGALGRDPIEIVGLDAFRAAAVTPGLIPTPAAGQPLTSLLSPQALFLSPAALAGRRLGDVVTIVAGTRTAAWRIMGTVPGAGEGRRIAVADISAAQARLGRAGHIDRVDLKLDADVDADMIAGTIRAMLPRGAVLETPADESSSTDALSRAYRVNLDMLALVALLTGAFLVYSAQALSVARRAPQFALLRVIGGTRSLVLGQVLAEGAVLGIVGAGAGIALGTGLAAGVLRLVGGDLGSGAFADEQAPPLVFAPGAALAFAALGIAAALIGSLLPARAAAAGRPVVALRHGGDAVDPSAKPRIMPALVLAVIAVVLALLPAAAGLPIAGYASIGLMLAAGIAAMPRVARWLLAPLAHARLSSPAAQLAVARLWGAPAQAAVALSGIVASIGLMAAMAVMVASFRGSVDEWLRQILGADIYLSLGGSGAALAPEDQSRLLAVRQVADADFMLQRPLALSPGRPPVILIVRRDPGAAFPAVGRSVPVPAGTVPVWVSEPFSRTFDVAAGDALALPLGPGVRARIAGVFRDYARQQGALALRAADADRLTGERGRSEAAISLAPGTDPGGTIAALRQALPPPLRSVAVIQPVADLRARALAIFDRSFAVTYALEAVAVAVGLAGVAATVSAQTIARTREFGMLRHLGVTRRLIVATLGIEGALIGAVGAVAGIGLGAAMAQVLIHVVNPQSFHWTMTTRWPIGLLSGVAAALVVAASGTAMIAGRRAVSLDAVRAVREDW
ncbi:FtsX-like permease family protein [Sphingomonas sp.]|uniref:FtsX-like permease family protein n=1 Tax=Sphingomonas sp. TaxID=28214 RepID=UPI003B00EE89